MADGEGWCWLVVLVGVANKINELALVEGNLPSSLVRVLLCCAPGSVCTGVSPPGKSRGFIHAKLLLL